MRLWMYSLAALLALTAPGAAMTDPIRPTPRPVADAVPTAQWDHRPEAERWSRAALRALKNHGAPLVNTEPEDIERWCPGYDDAPLEERRAFWVGFLSALAKYESTHRPDAVGGDGKWFGLLQIAPATARGYECRAGTGEALKDGADNLSCAIRIMAETVPRDGVIHARTPRWSGVAADWGPMRSEEKRREIREWLHAQPYCQLRVSLRPLGRPVPEGLISGPARSDGRPAARPKSTATATRFDQARPF